MTVVPRLIAADGISSRFACDGYVVFEGVLNGPHLDLLRTQCDRFVAREDRRMDAIGADALGLSHRGRRYFASGCQREEPALRAMLFSELMAEICRATMGQDAYFFLDQFVVQGPENGLPFDWHQDSGYVVGNGGPARHAPYLTCWCTLDNTTAENGTLRVVRGSHRLGIFPHDCSGGSGDLRASTEDHGVAVEVPAGSIVAFSSLLLHATGANLSDRPRRVYIAQYTAEPMLDPGSRHLRRDAIPLLRHGRQVTV